MPNVHIPHGLDRQDGHSWVLRPALRMRTWSSLRRPL